jgi:hypothetical protein
MSRVKHILLVVGLVVMAMPCCHATDLDAHEHDEGVAANICATHSCVCHSCDQTDCSDDLDAQPELRTLSSALVVTVEPVCLFTPPDPGTPVPQRPARVRSQLLSLMTIQLLI